MLFFAEMWERFSYYGMRALLILYLVRHWLYSDGEANLIYGAYTSLVYITPVLGGYLADRYLGQRKAVLFGAVLLTIGQFLMAIHGDGGQDDPTLNVFWLALAFIIVGSGFLEGQHLGDRRASSIRAPTSAATAPTRSSTWALTSARRSARSSPAISARPMAGASASAPPASACCSAWSSSSSIGRCCRARGEAPNPARLDERVLGFLKLEWFLYLLGFAAVGGIWLLIQYQGFYGWLLLIMGTMLLLFVLYEAFKLDPQARDRIFAIIFLIALQPVFWGLFEQAGGSLNLFTDRYVDRGGVPPRCSSRSTRSTSSCSGRSSPGCGRRSGARGSSPRRRPSSAWR